MISDHNVDVDIGERRAAKSVVLASLLTAVLYFIPFLRPIAYPFILLSTLVHEMGHGFAAMLVGGNFDSFALFADGSGVANIRGDFGNLSHAFVAAAGLLGPALVAGCFFLNIRTERRARITLAAFGILLSLAICMVVRNLFGIVFIAAIALISFYFSLGKGRKHAPLVLAFFATELGLSVFSRSDYLFTDTAITKKGLMPSDVAQIADALFLPYWFWGAVCGAFSVAILIFGIKRVFKKKW